LRANNHFKSFSIAVNGRPIPFAFIDIHCCRSEA
jgi:hypothetical protein